MVVYRWNFLLLGLDNMAINQTRNSKPRSIQCCWTRSFQEAFLSCRLFSLNFFTFECLCIVVFTRFPTNGWVIFIVGLQQSGYQMSQTWRTQDKRHLDVGTSPPGRVRAAYVMRGSGKTNTDNTSSRIRGHLSHLLLTFRQTIRNPWASASTAKKTYDQFRNKVLETWAKRFIVYNWSGLRFLQLVPP